MYAVVNYSDYRKEQSFEVITTTSNVKYAEKVAFQCIKKRIPAHKDDCIYKITTKVKNEHLRPINKTIVAYKLIEVSKHKKRFKIECTFAEVYAVIQLVAENEPVDDIDTSLICDNYYHSYDEYDDEDDADDHELTT
jgi:hypothetical protein